MRKVRITEVVVNQANHTPGDAISIGSGGVIGVTITNPPNSNNNVFVGWNGPASAGNLVIVGASKPYGNIDGFVLDGNKLYIGFDPSGSGGLALITLFHAGENVPELNEC